MDNKNYFLLFLAYLFPLVIGLNFFLKHKSQNKVNELKLYKELY